LSPAHPISQDIVFADNICEGGVLSEPRGTMQSSHVVVRGNMTRQAGNVTLNDGTTPF
jgi:hypothetical protein